MIKRIQKTFHSIISYQRIQLFSQPSQIMRNKVSLNYIPSINCSFSKQSEYMTIGGFGIPSQSYSNVRENQMLQEWQKDIVIKIKEYSDSDDINVQIDTPFIIVGFYQTYMYCLIKNPQLIVSIDKQISDFLENELKNVERNYSKNKPSYMNLALYRLKIQAKLLQHFDTLDLSQKIELYQGDIKFYISKPQRQWMMKSLKFKAILVLTLQKWIENNVEPNGTRQIEFIKYALDQLLKFFDELKTLNARNEEKIPYISTALNNIYFIFNSFKLSNYIQTKQLILEVLPKIQKAFQQFRNILPFEYYLAQMLYFIMEHIKFGYTEVALKITQELYQLRPQMSSTQFAISLDILLYYCLRKTENNSYDLDDFLQIIKPEGWSQQDQINYNQLNYIQQLHKLITQEKYEELQPIFTKILSTPFKTITQKYLLLPLLCDTLIYHPLIPNRLAYSNFLLSQIQSLDFPNDSNFLTIQRQFQKLILSFVGPVENDDNEYAKFSLNLQLLLKKLKGDKELEREIMCSVAKFVQQVSSEKNYKFLTGIIELCMSHFQEDKSDNGKLLEILNQQKINLRQKYQKA